MPFELRIMLSQQCLKRVYWAPGGAQEDIYCIKYTQTGISKCFSDSLCICSTFPGLLQQKTYSFTYFEHLTYYKKPNHIPEPCSECKYIHNICKVCCTFVDFYTHVCLFGCRVFVWAERLVCLRRGRWMWSRAAACPTPAAPTHVLSTATAATTGTATPANASLVSLLTWLIAGLEGHLKMSKPFSPHPVNMNLTHVADVYVFNCSTVTCFSLFHLFSQATMAPTALMFAH